jgi:hypothetical protein
MLGDTRQNLGEPQTKERIANKMNELKKLKLDAQIILGGTALYVILSFFDWQQYCVSFGGASRCAGQTEWHGIGIIAALFALVLLVIEINRMLKFAELPVDQALVSVGAAVTLLILTVITFLSHSEFRHWPEWAALIISIVITVVAVRRGREEGVEMPKMPSAAASGAAASKPAGDSGDAPMAAPPSTGTGDTGASSAGGGESGSGSSAGPGDSGTSAMGGGQEGEKPPEA